MGIGMSWKMGGTTSGMMPNIAYFARMSATRAMAGIAG